MKISPVFVLAALMLPSSAFAVTDPISLGTVGCKDRDVLARALQLSDQSDLHAAYEVIRRGFKSGDCRSIRMDKVVVESAPLLSRLVRVHVWGNPDAYWVIH